MAHRSADRTRRWLACALACSALAASPAAAAGPDAMGSEPTAADKATARRLMDVGDDKYRAGDYQGALEAYQGADRIMGVPTTGVEVGRALLKLGKLVEAADALLRVTRYPRAAGEPAPFTQARNDARALAEEVSRRIPSLRLTLTGLPPDTPVRATVCGVAVKPGTLLLPRSVNPGTCVIVAKAHGYRPITETVALAEQQSETVALRFETDSTTTTDTPEGDSGISPWVWVGFSVGAAGFVVGGITGGLALSEGGALHDECPETGCPPDRQSDLDRAYALAHVSTVSLILGGVGTAVGVTALLVDGGEEPTETAWAIEPLVAPGALGLGGRF